MPIKLIIIISFSYLYALVEIFMNLRQRKSNHIVNEEDKGSLRLLYILISVGYILAFSIGATKIGRIYHWDILFPIGAGFVIIGLIIRIIAMFILKKYFTYSVAKVENHQLIETSFYKIIRHPGYLGQLIIFIGISVSLSNYLSIILMAIPIIIGYRNRIKIEEKFMVKHLGDKYLDYQKRTKKLIPMIY